MHTENKILSSTELCFDFHMQRWEREKNGKVPRFLLQAHRTARDLNVPSTWYKKICASGRTSADLHLYVDGRRGFASTCPPTFTRNAVLARQGPFWWAAKQWASMLSYATSTTDAGGSRCYQTRILTIRQLLWLQLVVSTTSQYCSRRL